MMTTKATMIKATTTASSGLAVAEVFTTELTALMALGIFVSLFSLAYNEAHINKSDTLLKLITKGSKYILFGIFAYPSAFQLTGWASDRFLEFSSIPVQALVGVLATWFAVFLTDKASIGIASKFEKGEFK